MPITKIGGNLNGYNVCIFEDGKLVDEIKAFGVSGACRATENAVRKFGLNTTILIQPSVTPEKEQE